MIVPIPGMLPVDFSLRLRNETLRDRWKPRMDNLGNVLETYCNLFVQEVLSWFDPGYKRMAGLLASQMVAVMKDTPRMFAQVTNVQTIMRYAAKGYLVVAGAADEPHGHVNIVAPIDALQKGPAGNWSDSFRSWVPWAANVGKRNVYGERESRFFLPSNPPAYFLFIGE